MDSILVLGGCGFIGRNLVELIVKEKLATKIRAVDKTMPCLCNMPEALEALYDEDEGVVDFVQADLSKPEGVEKAFADGPWTYVVNVAGEAKPGSTAEIYAEHLTKVSSLCAKKAVGCTHYIEMSDASINQAKKGMATEESPEKPTGKLGDAHLAADKAIRAMDDLNWTIIRPGIVYGPGDKYGLMSRMVPGWIYRKLGKKMEVLWNADVPMHCIHVEDLCRAIIFCLEAPATVHQVLLAVDDTSLNQGQVNDFVGQIFGIKTGFVSKALNMAAKVKLKMAVNQVNAMHMDPWGEVCREAKIGLTPISPYLAKEQLKKAGICVSNEKLKGLGFKFTHPQVTKELLVDMIQGYVDLNLVPAL